MVDKGLYFILGLVASLAPFGTGTRAYSDMCVQIALPMGQEGGLGQVG